MILQIEERDPEMRLFNDDVNIGKHSNKNQISNLLADVR